jgi:hypothetical protein
MYTLDPCNIYRISNYGHKKNTQWIHEKMKIIAMNGYTMDLCIRLKIEDICNQWSEQTDPLQVPMLKRVVQSIQVE